MKSKIIKTLWGVPEVGDADKWPQMIERVAADGFDAIEFKGSALPAEHAARWRELLREHGMVFICQVHTADYVPRTDAAPPANNQGYVGSEDPEAHLASLVQQVRHAKELGAVLVNSHSGHDAWDLETGASFLRECLKVERDLGVPISHETHRRRLLWNPWQARDLLRAVPELKVTADLSHWCVAMERVPTPETDSTWHEILALVASRCVLVHARVGYNEGPQVPDPTAPEYAFECTEHMRWWRQIWAAQKARGVEVSYIEPEFGPEPYLHTMPHTGERAADLWEVNTFMGHRCATAFAADHGGDVRMRAGAKPRAARATGGGACCSASGGSCGCGCGDGGSCSCGAGAGAGGGCCGAGKAGAGGYAAAHSVLAHLVFFGAAFGLGLAVAKRLG